MIKNTEQKNCIAYLTGEYPRASDTFIQREVTALRNLGATILTCSIRRTGSEHLVGAEQQKEASNTFFVLESIRNPFKLIWVHTKIAIANPRRWFLALKLAWQTRPPGLRNLIYQLFYFAEAGVLAEHLRSNSATHLHNHFGNSSCSVAMLASEISGIPFSYTMHGPAIFFEPKHWRIDEKIARAQFVSCISHYCRSQGMLFAEPQYWPNMRIVHCGVELSRYKKGKSKSKNKHLLFVGRLAPIKGVLLLLDAFTTLLETHPDTILTLVGDGPSRPELEEKVQSLDLHNKVIFTGYKSQSEVATLLSATDIFVLPSFAEGVPVVLMEAMASSVPVIAPHVAGVPELVEDGKSGFLVSPGDTGMLVSSLRELLNNPELQVKMGETGRKKVEAEFDITKEAAWLLKLLNNNAPKDQLRPDN
jgi:glycosyltransferase involved in cell wall biosynthesis